MKYPFWVFDWNRVKDYQDKYPLTKEIFKHPLSLWYGNRSVNLLKTYIKVYADYLKEAVIKCLY